MGGKGSGGYPGCGRKPGVKSKTGAKRDEKLAIRIAPEILERLRSESQLSGLSQSDIVETALMRHWISGN